MISRPFACHPEALAGSARRRRMPIAQRPLERAYPPLSSNTTRPAGIGSLRVRRTARSTPASRQSVWRSTSTATRIRPSTDRSRVAEMERSQSSPSHFTASVLRSPRGFVTSTGSSPGSGLYTRTAETKPAWSVRTIGTAGLRPTPGNDTLYSCASVGPPHAMTTSATTSCQTREIRPRARTSVAS